MLEELAGLQEQMVAMENELLQQGAHVEELEKARDYDREIREDMLADIKSLEELNEELREKIIALEKDLERCDWSKDPSLQGAVKDKIDDMKAS